MFNDVVGLDLLFPKYQRKTHPTCHEHRVLGALRCIVLFHFWPSRERLSRTAHRNNWRSNGRPRILVVDQQHSICTGIFADKVETDGIRLEVTPLKAPWRNGKTERAGNDWKEDNFKMTQDDPSLQT